MPEIVSLCAIAVSAPHRRYNRFSPVSHIRICLTPVSVLLMATRAYTGHPDRSATVPPDVPIDATYDHAIASKVGMVIAYDRARL